MMVMTENSVTGILRDPSVPIVGRFKLSEIANIDQSPLPFEHLKGRTYEKKGNKTVRLKGGRSGWDKRQCTLQIAVFADGVMRIKPLLIFKGKTHSKDSCRRTEYKKYHSGVVVIFNEKAWANTSNLIDCVKNQYSTASAYPLCDNEPRFLSLDAFAPHKNKGQKAKAKESEKAREKRLVEEKLQQELRDQFAKLKVTTSIIPGGCTGYVQVLDVTVNKIVKQYIEEAEDLWVDENFDKWESGSYSVGDRRVLMTKWVAEAWEKVHKDHQDAIINTFRNVGLSLPTDGSQDHELSIRDLPNIIVGDWTKVPEATIENPIVIPDNGETIEVDNDTQGLLYTAREVDEGIVIKEENEEDVITGSGDESNQSFDYDSESSFDDNVDSDEDEQDEDIE